MVTPSPKIPASHLTRLMVLGYVTITADGPWSPLPDPDHRKRVNKTRLPLDSHRTK
jgi:hypothetical protein